MTTLVLIPGLVSDRIVWEPLAETAADMFPVHHADVSTQASITEMAQSVLAAVDGPIIADFKLYARCVPYLHSQASSYAN